MKNHFTIKLCQKCDNFEQNLPIYLIFYTKQAELIGKKIKQVLQN